MFFQDFALEKMTSHMKVLFDITLFATVFFGIAALNPEAATMISNGISSIGGAVTLVYFRRERDYREIFFKGGCAAIMGFFIAWAIATYYGIQEPAYRSAAFFFAGLLSIFFIKGLLSITEQNASGMVISIIQRFLPVAAGYKVVPTDSPNAELPPAIVTQVEISKDGEKIAETKLEKDE